MPLGGINCKFIKKQNCTIKTKKFLFWSYFDTCKKFWKDEKCAEQVKILRPPPPPPAPPRKYSCCHCNSNRKSSWSVSPSRAMPPNKPRKQ